MIIHIVGINTFIKDELINKFKELGFEIFDLDILSKNILFDSNKNKMGKMWKDRLNLQKEIFLSTNSNKNIIILGLSNFVLDHRYKININTEFKYFLNIPYEICASQLIMYNLDKYRMDIIEGKFPIKYLEHEFLLNQRRELEEEYTEIGYELKTINDLFEIMDKLNKNNLNQNNNLNNKVYLDNKVYLAFIKRFENTIPDSFFGSKSIIYGYTEKWMALASILPNSSIGRGFLQNNNKNIPYLKELHLKAFDKLKKPCYLYEFSGKNKIDEYRYELNSTNFDKREYISNNFNELIREGVILEEFKF
jgi:hypothetical protein